MRYISLFSGVEAASVAWEPLGWEPVCFCEKEEFPSAVLAYRFPDVPNLGDVKEVDWSEVYGRYGAVDILVGGSPCQSFSIAGDRTGRAGQSGLMFEYIRAIQDLLQASGGACPRYILWENVPGALSAEKGVAFGQLLSELDELGYGLAWRILDAQYVRISDRSPDGFFGPVAQRRRRVFLVGVLGSPHAAEILFERESLRWDHPKGREAREALAEHPSVRAGMGYCAGFKWFMGAKARGIGYEDGMSPTLSVSDGHVPAIALQSEGSLSDESQSGRQSICYPSFCMQDGQAKGTILDDGTATTLNASHEQPIIIDRAAFNQGENAAYPPHIEQSDTMDTLVARGPHAICHRAEIR